MSKNLSTPFTCHVLPARNVSIHPDMKIIKEDDNNNNNRRDAKWDGRVLSIETQIFDHQLWMIFLFIVVLIAAMPCHAMPYSIAGCFLNVEGAEKKMTGAAGRGPATLPLMSIHRRCRGFSARFLLIMRAYIYISTYSDPPPPSFSSSSSFLGYRLGRVPYFPSFKNSPPPLYYSKSNKFPSSFLFYNFSLPPVCLCCAGSHRWSRSVRSVHGSVGSHLRPALSWPTDNTASLAPSLHRGLC